MRRYVVRAGDPRTVGEIVRLAGGDPGAVREGRVFVGRVRAGADGEPVRAGDEVRVAAPAEPAPRIDLLHADDDLVVVAKPAGVSTIPDHAGAARALSSVAAALAGAPPGSLHATSRLDRDVSGVVTFARTERAARALLAARASGGYARRYVALASRAPVPASGTWDAPIGRAKDARRRAVGGRDPVPASTRFHVVAEASRFALLALEPVTGRTHQLRVHAAHAGAPLVGDRAYGGPTRVTLANGRVVALDRVALHCAHVTIDAGPFQVDASAPVPADLLDLWTALGGEPGAWDRGARCEP